ncbi:hypothetical protein [uncultured Bdellovibrio sp.]|uniref:hypothetical protein n=1 Tax=Bdellovibrio sp. HCB-162 TaxID=3394234 RepID=UPI0025E8D809|nr:hypothetical protein [uncultured Bdellovibrio sp.]
MNSFKQALNHLKSHWQQSLALGAAASVLLLLTRYLPYIGAFFISLILLIFQHATEQWLAGKNWKDISFLKKALPAFIIVSVILFPTSVLVGSSMGIIQSSQGFFVAVPTAWGLLMIAVYFYLVLSHSLRLRFEDNVGIAKAIDIAGMASLKNFKLYFILSFYLSLLLVLSGFAWNIGLLVILPLLFFSSHFSFIEMKKMGLLQVAN